ncbi:hypothetical protein RI129_010139 [Pyrocoelia pectoralis]|uniref:Uncharacterized protein n=1 Tax=Pyrocoelia pectoralis TaxID=417401 RepID=A0AAN7V643_9COLE
MPYFINGPALAPVSSHCDLGVIVALHHPCEFPNLEKHFRLPLDQAVFVSIKPSLITVSKDLWNYSPNDRKCYLTDEKYLASSKFYTQQNCLDECLANYTLAQCECVPFYLPRTSPFRYSHMLPSTVRGQVVSIALQVTSAQFKYMKLESNDESNQQCECLPLCVSLSYHVETSHTDWDWEKANNILPNNENPATKKKYVTLFLRHRYTFLTCSLLQYAFVEIKCLL